jgi:hypothetical protein
MLFLSKLLEPGASSAPFLSGVTSWIPACAEMSGELQRQRMTI